MDSRCNDRSYLIARIERVNSYLATGSEFDELIENLKLKGDRLNTAKPVVEIVSPSPPLANNFKQKNLANSQLRSLYKFQVTTSVNKIQQIIQHCDLICFIYYFKHKISKQHQQLIELARQKNIGLILLVRQPNENVRDASLSGWLEAQDCSLDEVLLLDSFIDLNQQDIDYQQLLWQSQASIENRFIARQVQNLKTIIEDFFYYKIASVRQEKFFDPSSDKPPHYYRQQLEQILNSTRQEKQQFLTKTKQNINYLKFDLLNPFITESLMFTVRQIIDRATIKVVREAEVTYLYLAVDNSVRARYIHDYVIELCQQRTKEIIAVQWSQINQVYSEGGLHYLISKIDEELKNITNLVVENNFLLLPNRQPPNFNLAEFIDIDCLKANSRIVFDYNFTHSSWFRLLISVLVGLGIYFVTWIFLGSGKYIGFAIIIFQIVNLITGQNPKKARLKQHSKELKQLVNRQYQTLVRLVVDKLVQTLNTALERETELYWNKLDTAIAAAKVKLERSSSAIAKNKAKIDELQQQKAKVLSWLD